MRLRRRSRRSPLTPRGSEVFNGEHNGIVPKALFDKVQRLMAENHRTGGAGARNRSGALLRRLLRCTACDAPMVHTVTKSHSKVYRYYVCSSAQKKGRVTCPTASVAAGKIEDFVVNQIRRIGADPSLQDETFRQAVAQVKAQRRGLKLEARRLKIGLGKARDNVERLVETISRVTGPAADAVAGDLSSTQERMARLELRQTEIKNELATLDPQAIDREQLTRALESFDPIWDVLLTPEKERVLRLLIERMDFDGKTGKMTIQWRLAGFGQLVEEIGS